MGHRTLAFIRDPAFIGDPTFNRSFTVYRAEIIPEQCAAKIVKISQHMVKL